MIKNIITFKNLSDFPNLTHAVSTRSYGSIKDSGKFNFTSVNNFVTSLKIPRNNLVLAEQIHGSGIAEITTLPKNKIIKSVDGLITKSPDIFLGIVSADCLPILLFDREKSVIGIVHGGYQGLSKLIIKQVIKKFRNLGSNNRNIIVGIGPGIGFCCYSIPCERLKMFEKNFPLHYNWHRKEKNNYYIDLKKIALMSLINEGIEAKNIEVSDICTVHEFKHFYSYRKEGEKAGRFISIIGLK